jgi:hypothetical protein
MDVDNINAFSNTSNLSKLVYGEYVMVLKTES